MFSSPGSPIGARAGTGISGINRAGGRAIGPELMRNVLIIGCGRHGRIVAEAITQRGEFRVVGFADDDPAKRGTVLDGVPVVGPWQQSDEPLCFIAIGHNATRRRIFTELLRAGRQLITVISPTAYVSPHAQIGVGSVVLAGAVIQAGATVGEIVLVNAGAVVDHDAVVGDYAHLGLHSTVESFAKVAAGEWLAPGAVRLKNAVAG